MPDSFFRISTLLDLAFNPLKGSLDTVLTLLHNSVTRRDGGHGGRVVTLSPPTSAAGVRSPSWP